MLNNTKQLGRSVLLQDNVSSVRDQLSLYITCTTSHGQIETNGNKQTIISKENPISNVTVSGLPKGRCRSEEHLLCLNASTKGSAQQIDSANCLALSFEYAKRKMREKRNK